MKSIKSLLLSLLFLSFAATAFQVEAVRLDPNAGEVQPGSVSTIAVIAAPPGDATAVQLRLNVTGATVVGWSNSPDSSILSIGSCNTSNDKFTAGTVCVDLAITSGFIGSNQVLGSFDLRFSETANEAVVITGSTNAYLLSSGSLQTQANETVATFTIDSKTTATPTIPVTGIEDYPVLAIMGFGVILAGGAIYLIRNKQQVETAERSSSSLNN